MSFSKLKSFILQFLCLSCLSFFQLTGANAQVSCADLFTLKSLVPEAPREAQRFIEQNRANFSLLPQIEPKQFSDLREIDNDGELNLGSYTAQFRSKKVFIKKLERFGAQEAYWLMYLNRIGLGVHFYGVVKIDGGYGLVTQFTPGFNIKIRQGVNQLPPDFKMTKAMVQEMRRQTELAYSFGVAADGDPQFLISPEQVRMIDVHYFSSIEKIKRSLQEVLEDLDLQIDLWRKLGRLE